MTYVSPELLLVGAAQNLVLDTSPLSSSGACADESFEGVPQNYDLEESW